MNDKFKIPEREFRALREFRASEETDNTLEGYAAIYGEKTAIGDWFYEIIERGAFDKCNLDDVALFVNHDMNEVPLARSRRNNKNSTLYLQTDDQGLKIRATLDTENNSDAKKTYSAIKRGDMDGMSFCFTIKDAEWLDIDSDMPTRVIKSVSRVYEVSAVNYPAYEGTEIYARALSSLDNERKALDNARAEKRNKELRALALAKTKI